MGTCVLRSCWSVCWVPASACSSLGMLRSHMEVGGGQARPRHVGTEGSLSTTGGSKWHLLAAFEKQMLNSYIIRAVLTWFTALYHMSALYFFFGGACGVDGLFFFFGFMILCLFSFD